MKAGNCQKKVRNFKRLVEQALLPEDGDWQTFLLLEGGITLRVRSRALRKKSQLRFGPNEPMNHCYAAF
jgi:hypothetical protein